MVEKVRHGPIRDTFAWEVVERRAPRLRVIRAASKRFGQKVKIAYRLSEEGGGTRWEREMRFYFPRWFAPLDRSLVGRDLRRNSETAVRRLKELTEAP